MNEHILDSELDLIYNEIMMASRPEDVFATPTKNLPLTEQKAAITRRFGELRKVVDPSRYTRVVDVNAAGDAHAALQKLYETALAELIEGVATMEFTIHRTTYHVGERIAIGENSVLHRAIATKDGISDDVVLKIAHDANGSKVLATEAEYLRSFRSVEGRNPIMHVTRTLPELKDSFSVEGRRVTVVPYYHGRKNVREIVEHFDHNVPVGHAAWIARRVVALPITAHLAGLSHNAITPEHVLVHPITHEPIYLGWGHATPTKDDPRGDDLRATGRMLWYLFGDLDQETWNTETPDTLRTMIASLANASDRKSGGSFDLSQFFTDFTAAIYKSLGKQYRPLKLNS